MTVGRVFNANIANRIELGSAAIAPLITGSAALTLTAWFRIAGGSGARCIISIEVGGSVTGLQLAVDTTGVARGSGRSVSSDSFQSKLGTTSLSTATWYHLAAVYNITGDTITIYLNGTAETSGGTSVTFGNTTFTPSATSGSVVDRIGTSILSTPTEPFNGDIADVAIFKYAVSGSDITAMAGGTRPDQISGQKPICYWPMDSDTDGAGRFVYDRCGGVVGIPVGDVAPSATPLPTINATGSVAPERRFRLRALRLKAEDASAVGTGNPVSSVEVRGAGALATNSAGARPTYQSISGKHALRFDGTDDYLTCPAGVFTLVKGMTVVALADVTADGRFVSCAAAAGAEVNGFVMTAANGLICSGTTLGFSAYTDYTVSSTGLAIFSGRFSGNENVNWLNAAKRNGTMTAATEKSDGSFVPNTLPSASTTLEVQFGRRTPSGTSLFLNGDLYDIIVVDGALTDEEVRYLEGVIAWENASTSLLPSDHPWKNVQPTVTSTITYPWGNAVVNRSHLPNTIFTGSPSLLCRSNGDWLASHDYYNATDTGSTGRLYLSQDSGTTWHGLAYFATYQWGTIWEHTDGNLYTLSTTRADGDLQIGKSTDNGATWTYTTLSNGTLLTAAGATTTPPNYHRGGGLQPCYANSYLYFACENNDNGAGGKTWASGFKSFVLYAPVAADLMTASNWKVTAQLAVGTTGLSNRTEPSATPGFLEGNIVADDTGALWNVLRMGGSTTLDIACFIPLTWNGGTEVVTYPTWDQAFIKAFKGGQCKFQLVKSGSSFYTIANPNTAAATGGTSSTNDQDVRNRVGLIQQSSADLSSISASEINVIIDESALETGMSTADSITYHGFQYPAIAISGGFRSLYRVAWSGAKNWHDANFIGFGSIISAAQARQAMHHNRMRRA